MCSSRTKNQNELPKDSSASGPPLFGPCLLYCLGFSLVCSLLPVTSSTIASTPDLSALTLKPSPARGKYEVDPSVLHHGNSRIDDHARVGQALSTGVRGRKEKASIAYASLRSPGSGVSHSLGKRPKQKVSGER